jgi:hypothetical protein
MVVGHGRERFEDSGRSRAQSSGIEVLFYPLQVRY